MLGKYYLVVLLTNTKGQDGSNLSVFTDLDTAKVNYHNTLATYHNAQDVLYAVVEILDEYGRIVGGNNGYTETVDHRPEPEPTPEPTTETTEE